jgi:hypothetical protein
MGFCHATEYWVEGRKAKWVGSIQGAKEKVHEFLVEGDLDSRTFSDSDLETMFSRLAFRQKITGATTSRPYRASQ